MERIPFLQWGDLRKNKKAILRYALCGEEAHLPVYLYVYLKELYEYEFLLNKNIFAHNLLALKKKVSRKFPQKSWLISEDQIDRAAFAFFITHQEPNTKIYELGSTICSLKLKLRFLKKALRKKIIFNYVGIEKNKLLTFLTKKFYKNQKIIQNLPRFKKPANSLFISRYVSSYVFDQAKSFADHLKTYSFGFITEPFFSKNKDYVTYNHGLKNTYFDFAKFYSTLSASHNLYVTSAFVDCPAGTDFCVVPNIIFVQKNKCSPDLIENLRKFGLETKLLESDFVNSFLRHTSKEELKNIKFYKRLSPVWGRSDLQSGHSSVANSFKLFLTRRKKMKNYNFEFDNIYLSQESLQSELQNKKQ